MTRPAKDYTGYGPYVPDMTTRRRIDRAVRYAPLPSRDDWRAGWATLFLGAVMITVLAIIERCV